MRTEKRSDEILAIMICLNATDIQETIAIRETIATRNLLTVTENEAPHNLLRFDTIFLSNKVRPFLCDCIMKPVRKHYVFTAGQDGFPHRWDRDTSQKLKATP